MAEELGVECVGAINACALEHEMAYRRGLSTQLHLGVLKDYSYKIKSHRITVMTS